MTKTIPKPCRGCGGTKRPGRGYMYCEACAELRLPLAQEAEMTRRQIKNATSKRQRLNQTLALGRKPVRFIQDAPEGQKWCPGCEKYKPIEAFGAANTKPGGLAARCRPCNSNYHHARRMRLLFDMTADDYDALLDLQDGRCAICRCRPRTVRLAVDHDHGSGGVRGLICMRCNHKLLGTAKDDPAVLRRAARYLEQPPAQTGAQVPETDEDLLRLAEVVLSEPSEGLPIVIARPDGAGPASIADWPVIMRLADVTELLHGAGYGDGPP